MNFSIRIAYIVHTFDVGGLERCVANLANHLDRDRFLPSIICLNRNGNAANWIERDDVVIHEIRKKPRNDFGAIRRLAKLLKDEQIDIVHSHNWGTLIETTLARRWAKTPVHIHAERGTLLGSLSTAGFKMGMRIRAMRWAAKRCDVMMTPAHSIAERLSIICRIPVSQVEVIPNGVKSAEIENRDAVRSEIRESLSIPQNAFVVGSVGRLQHVKGFDIALKAVAKLVHNDFADHPSQMHFLLVGNGPERTNLEEIARSLKIEDRIHFAGDRKDVPRFLAAMDVYCNSSRSEGMSQSIVEAMSAGLPMVVTDVGDNARMVQEFSTCGLVVNPEEDIGLSEALRSICKSNNQRHRFWDNARLTYQSYYHFTKMINRYDSMYSNILKKTLRFDNIEQQILC